jgi:peptide/nickel transport system ATP-binding protein
MTDSLLTVEHLTVSYHGQGGSVKNAVSDVSLRVGKGDSLGLVGESGCGKSSLAKAVMRFIKPVSGRILLGREDLTSLDKYRLRQLRSKFQMIFQESASSLNPGRTIGDAIALPMELSGIKSRAEIIDRVCKMMEQVGLDPSGIDLLPYQLSGGQCQRVQIARALITEPELLICDEPVSSLDVSVQAQIINLLKRLRDHAKLTMLFISHDLSVVKHICRRIAVMYAGKLCEISYSDSFYQAPLHPYSKLLLSAIPTIGKFKKDHMIVGQSGEMYSFAGAGHGCEFRPQCYQAQKRCSDEEPLLTKISPGVYVACHYPLLPRSFK